MFSGEYLGLGRHHSVIYAIEIPMYLSMIGIDDEREYRIFFNDAFCNVMKADTDGTVDFFSHSKLEDIKLSHQPEEIHLEQVCPECGKKMIVKFGKYGPFLSCSDYPQCKHSSKIPILGNYVTNWEKIAEQIRNKEY